jgi:hypothetical protein
VGSLLVVVVEELTNTFAVSSAALGGILINVVVFECAPQSLEEALDEDCCDSSERHQSRKEFAVISVGVIHANKRRRSVNSHESF